MPARMQIDTRSPAFGRASLDIRADIDRFEARRMSSHKA
jgi:hypothetical protein